MIPVISKVNVSVGYFAFNLSLDVTMFAKGRSHEFALHFITSVSYWFQRKVLGVGVGVSVSVGA